MRKLLLIAGAAAMTYTPKVEIYNSLAIPPGFHVDTSVIAINYHCITNGYIDSSRVKK